MEIETMWRAARQGWRHGGLVAHTTLGAVLGVLMLHPFTMAIVWLEWHRGNEPLLHFVSRIWGSFTPEMLAMTAAFAVLGAVFGLTFGGYERAFRESSLRVERLARELGTDLPSLLASGESDRLELKSTLRWDLRQGKVNHELETAIVRAIAGLMNHRGGSVVIGVADDGSVVGLARDYSTLKHKNRDGFEQTLITLVTTRLGADACSLLYAAFAEVDGKDVCRVVVHPAPHPVFCRDATNARYFVRAGNGTRELDVQEALRHVALRWPARRHPGHGLLGDRG